MEVGSSVEGRLELQAGRRMVRVGRCLARSATSPAATRRRLAWRAVAGRAGGSLGGGGRGGAGRSAGTGRPGEPACRGTVSVGREQLLLACSITPLRTEGAHCGLAASVGRRGSARGARAKGNQGFGRSVEVQPCCRPLRAAQFLPLSAVSILSFYSDTRFSLEYQSSQALLPTPSGPVLKDISAAQKMFPRFAVVHR